MDMILVFLEILFLHKVDSVTRKSGLTTESEHQCNRMCWYSKECGSSLWDRKTKICQLSTGPQLPYERGSLTDLTAGASYLGDQHACASRPCAENEICVPTEAGRSKICITAPVKISCGSTPGYHLEGSGLCLKRGGLKLTWSAAKVSCENDGASLLKIESREKNAALRLLLIDGTHDYEWTGGNDLATEGTYVWADGTPIQGFTDWRRAEPDGGRIQNCMSINPNGWASGGCGDYKIYMCEKIINMTRVIGAG